MIFLLIFSYVILFDFFPLYDYPEDVCAPASVSVNHKEHPTDATNNDLVTRYPASENQSVTNKSIPYGFQRHNQPSFNELLLFIWVFTLICEEIRQVGYYHPI